METNNSVNNEISSENSEFNDKIKELLKIDILNFESENEEDYDSTDIIESRDQIIELLQININKVNSLGQSALIIASKLDHFNVVKYLISRDNCNVNLADNDNHDVLHYSIIYRNDKICDLLIKTRKFDLNKIFTMTNRIFAMKNKYYSCTYLIFAVLHENYRAVEYLIDNGADANILNKNDMNAFMIACKNKYYNYVELLVNHTNDINYKSKKYNLSGLDFLFGLHNIKDDENEEVFLTNCNNYSTMILDNRFEYSRSSFHKIIRVASSLIEKKPNINAFQYRYESLYFAICVIIFDNFSENTKYILLFRKFIEDGMNIDECLNLNGAYYIFEVLHEFIFNFKISNRKILLHVLQFDDTYVNIFIRIEYNKSFINNKILKKQIDKMNFLPDGYKTLFTELTFAKKSDKNIDDVLYEDRFYKLKLLFDIYDGDDLNRFYEKYNKILIN